MRSSEGGEAPHDASAVLVLTEHESVCYRGGTMEKRAGVTEKVSISLSRDDLKALKARAMRLHGGNLSAVIAELAADARQLEAMDALVEQLGGPSLTMEARERLDREWRVAPPPPKRKPRSKKAA